MGEVYHYQFIIVLFQTQSTKLFTLCRWRRRSSYVRGSFLEHFQAMFIECLSGGFEEKKREWKVKRKGRSRDILRVEGRRVLWNCIKTAVTVSQYIYRTPQNSLFSLGPKWTETGKHSAAPPFFFSLRLVHFFPSTSSSADWLFFFFFCVCVLSFSFAARLKHLVRVSFKYQKEASDRQFSIPLNEG